MSGRSRWLVALLAVSIIAASVVVVRAVVFDCQWGTFAYTVEVHKIDSQEDQRSDAAVLVEGEETVVTANHHATGVGLSPDGKQIVVASATGLNGDEFTESKPTGLYIHDIDGSNVTLLTKPGGTSPTWSPDGETIAFMNGGKIWTVDVDDRESRPIYELPRSKGVSPYLSHMAWSGDSKQIAFTVGNSPGVKGTGLWAMNRDGSDLQLLWSRRGRGIESFDWSPDGERFAYEGAYWVRLVDRDGKKEVKVESYADGPKWSRDGSQLAYFIDQGGQYAQIVVADSDGKNAKTMPRPKGMEGRGWFSDWVSC